MSDNKNATGKSDTAKPNTNAEEMDLASKPVVDAKAIYGEPPAANEESASENEAAKGEKA
ncbi:hypothetical protein IQ255_03555 [Pleurocapsales cyanobacterium LEGE 10410]|nr:hypothetical protein [Pleurocapsales cyanobacterium LEGE 10410]